MADLFFYAYPIAWFAWDVCNNAMILAGVRYWIKKNVGDTSDMVLAKIIEPEMAKKVRVAWDIPNRVEIKEDMKQELLDVQELLWSSKSSTDSKLESIRTELNKEITKLIESTVSKQLSDFELKINKSIATWIPSDEAIKCITRSMSGYESKSKQIEMKRAKPILERYFKNSSVSNADKAEMWDLLVAEGIDPGEATNAIQAGPPAVKSIWKTIAGPKLGGMLDLMEQLKVK